MQNVGARMLPDEIQTHVCQYLTLSEYRSFALTCKRYHQLAIEILKGEAVYFGGTKEGVLTYFKSLCTVIQSPSFPPELIKTKKPSNSAGKRKQGPIDYRETLLTIRSITFSECSLLFDKLSEEVKTLYPLICKSRIEEGDPIKLGAKTSVLRLAVRFQFHFLAARALVLGGDPDVLYGIYNAFHEAILSKDPQLVELLLLHDAEPNIRTAKNNPPLLLAAKTNCLATLLILLKNGSRDHYHAASDFPSALYFCLAKDYIDLARAIKENTNILTCQDRSGGTYLHMAMQFLQDWMLENFDPTPMLNSQDRHLNTALHIAMKQHYEAGIRFLARHRALYQIENLDQETALDLCPPNLLHLFNY